MKNDYYRKPLLVVLMGLLLVFNSCELVEYSPYQVKLKESEKDLNRKNAEKIAALGLKPTDTLRIALISDTQRFYDETEDFVQAINQRTEQKGHKIHFVLHGGDISDFGLLEEYRWQHQILKKLKMPYLVVLGNHDCVANGDKVYANMYGPFEQVYQFARNRLILLNTNTMEFTEDIVRLDFLENNLRDTENYDNVIVLAHVSPFDEDYDRKKEAPYAQLIRQYRAYPLHGHKHTHRIMQPYNDGINYMIIGSVSNRRYVELTIVGKKITHEVVDF
ncbi:phosphoesterase [Adhaeribacter aerolatus]|uniref:Phosphoesterase n=1 Tax=Adhaeribacter aerolatus TaxID=670289 RepID=A0A512B2X7_9BACT|nr:metallophosphoesterase [Adhaeribacter aerolatus]GEO06310.1 phosphoesterase [Adhaeribacter aerolatus]